MTRFPSRDCRRQGPGSSLHQEQRLRRAHLDSTTARPMAAGILPPRSSTC